MVIGAMVLMQGVHIGTLYKLLGNVDSIECNNIVVPKINSNTNQIDSNRAKLYKMT